MKQSVQKWNYENKAISYNLKADNWSIKSKQVEYKHIYIFIQSYTYIAWKGVWITG